MTTPIAGSSAGQNRLTLLLALASVYILWGSTYLFVHFMTERMPPLYMASLRLSAAGGLLYLYARLTGTPAPRRNQWLSAGGIGVLLLTVANGCMTLALQHIPTSVAALISATVPVFIMTLNWVAFGRVRPTGTALLGLAVGLVGVALLIRPDGASAVGPSLWTGVGLITVGNLSWAVGTLLSARLSLPPQLISSAVQMLVGGLIMFTISMLTEGVSVLTICQAPPKALGALVYLIIFGSIIGFSSFAWLARHAPPQLVSTYAYVNPVVAMGLGWAFAGEALTAHSFVAAAVILAGVVLITLGRRN